MVLAVRAPQLVPIPKPTRPAEFAIRIRLPEAQRKQGAKERGYRNKCFYQTTLVTAPELAVFRYRSAGVQSTLL